MTPSLHVRNLIRTSSLAAATFALATIARAYDVPTAPELDGNSTKENWISISAGSINGERSAASLQRRRQHEDSGFGGVDSLRLKKSVFGDKTLRIDGKAILGDNEFLLKAVLEDEANGWYLEAGFRESRVFYSGTGGYSPGALWHQPFDDQVYIDRGEYWLETGVKKDVWSLKVRGSHSYRKGTKDSTQWGDTAYAGLGTATRNIVPTPLYIDEERNSLQIDLGYENEGLEAGAGLRFETIETENSRVVVRNPGQANPTGNGERYLWTTEGSDSDLFAGHMYVVKSIGDRLTLSGAASKTKMDTVLSGERVYSATPFGAYSRTFPRGSTAHGYIDMEGETQWDQWVLLGNANFIATKGWTITGGIRFENQTQDSFSEYIETAGPASNPLEEPFEQEGEREFDELLATLEANYNGIDNVVITPFLEYSVGEGSLVENQIEGHAPTTLVVVDRDTDFDRDYFKYGLTARWYPAKWANGAVGAYCKERGNTYKSRIDNTPPTGGNRYPAYIADQDFSTDDVYVKGTLRASSSLSFTARYDRMETEIESTEVGLGAVISAEQKSEIVSATLNWSATSNIAVQAGVNLVSDDMLTGTVNARSAAAPSIGQFSSDYTTYNAIVMVALDENADLQLDFYRFEADNYRGLHTLSLPYGMDANEDVFGATYTRKISADLTFSLRFVYGTYTERTAGGFHDYDSRMLYGRMQMRF